MNPNMYQITVATSMAKFVSEKEYRTLVDACVDATVFNDWPWLTTAIDHLPKDQQFIGVLVRNNDEQLIAMLPLRIAQESLHGVSAQVARFIQYPLGDRIGILLDPEHKDAWTPLLDYLQQLSGAFWDCMIWNEWTDTQGLVEKSAQWADNNEVTVFHRVTSQCPVLSLEFNTEEEKVASYPSKKKRTELRRLRNRLAPLNSTTTHIRPTKEDTPELVDRMRSTEAASWKGNEGVGIFNDPQTIDFFNDVSKRLAEYDQLDLSIITIDDELASYKYGFYFRNTFLDYSIGYLPKHSKLGLGRLLLDDLVNAATEEGYSAVDASRVGAVTQHLLIERTDNKTPHHRFYFFGKNTKGKLLKTLVVKIKPNMKSLRHKYREWQASRGVSLGKAEK